MIETYLAIVTHPITWVFIIATAVVFGVQWIVARSDEDKPADKIEPLNRFAKRLGMGGVPRIVLVLGMLMWGAIFTMLFIGLLLVLWVMITGPLPDPNKPSEIWNWRFSLVKLTALTATLGAVVALPFTLVKIGFARRQTASAEAKLELETIQLFEDRLEKALNNMSARFEYKAIGRNLRNIKPVGETFFQWRGEGQPLSKQDTSSYSDWATFSETRENVELRVAGISQIEGIAREGVQAWLRIRSLLNGYLRQNAPIAAASESPRRYYDRLSNEGMTEGEIAEHYGVWADIQDTEYMHEWLASLTIRDDIDQAMRTFGRLQAKYKDADNVQKMLATIEHTEVKNDFANLNLQNVHLENTSFLNSNFEFSAFEGATVQDSNFQRCNFKLSRWDGSKVIFANFSDCNFQYINSDMLDWQRTDCRCADFQCVKFAECLLVRLDCSFANFNHARFLKSQLKTVTFAGCSMDTTQFSYCHLDDCVFENCKIFSQIEFKRVGLVNIDLSETDVTQDQIDECFGDKSVNLPQRIKRPENWPDRNLGPDMHYQEYVKWRSNKNVSDYEPPRALQ